MTLPPALNPADAADFARAVMTYAEAKAPKCFTAEYERMWYRLASFAGACAVGLIQRPRAEWRRAGAMAVERSQLAASANLSLHRAYRALAWVCLRAARWQR